MLKPDWKSWEEDKKDRLTAIERLEKLHNEVMEEFPKDIEATLSMSDVGKFCIKAIISLEKGAPEEVTKKAVGFLTKKCDEIERFFREDQGTFSWKGVKQIVVEHSCSDRGGYEEIILLEYAHPQKCTIKKVKKTVAVYESHCPDGGEKNAQIRMYGLRKGTMVCY